MILQNKLPFLWFLMLLTPQEVGLLLCHGRTKLADGKRPYIRLQDGDDIGRRREAYQLLAHKRTTTSGHTSLIVAEIVISTQGQKQGDLRSGWYTYRSVCTSQGSV